jgi:hypothetical protein
MESTAPGLLNTPTRGGARPYRWTDQLLFAGRKYRPGAALCPTVFSVLSVRRLAIARGVQFFDLGPRVFGTDFHDFWCSFTRTNSSCHKEEGTTSQRPRSET